MTLVFPAVRRRVALVAAICCAVVLPGNFSFADDYALEPIAEGLYGFRAGSRRSLVVIGDNGVIVVDPLSVDAAAALYAELATLTEQPVRHVIYSNSLADRTRGGALFRQAGAQFLAQEQCARNLAESAHAEIMMPDLTFKLTHSVRVGNRGIDLYYLGPHLDNCGIVMITWPDRLLYIVGTVEPPGARLPADPSMANVYVYNLVSFLSALGELAERERVQALIAGTISGEKDTSPIGPVRVITEQRQLWTQLFTDVERALAAGVPSANLGSGLEQAGYRQVPGYDSETFGFVARRVATALVTGK